MFIRFPLSEFSLIGNILIGYRRLSGDSKLAGGVS